MVIFGVCIETQRNIQLKLLECTKKPINQPAAHIGTKEEQEFTLTLPVADYLTYHFQRNFTSKADTNFHHQGHHSSKCTEQILNPLSLAFCGRACTLERLTPASLLVTI